MGFLDTLIYGYRRIQDGADTILLQRDLVKFVGASSVVDDAVNKRTVVTLTGSSTLAGDGGGYANVTASNGIKATPNANETDTDYFINSALATASATAILTVATTANHFYSVRGVIRSQNAAMGLYSEWELNCNVRNVAGTVTVSATPLTNKVNSTGFSLAFAASGTNMVLTATDPSAAAFRWTGRVLVEDSVY